MSARRLPVFNGCLRRWQWELRLDGDAEAPGSIANAYDAANGSNALLHAGEPEAVRRVAVGKAVPSSSTGFGCAIPPF